MVIELDMQELLLTEENIPLKSSSNKPAIMLKAQERMPELCVKLLANYSKNAKQWLILEKSPLDQFRLI